MWVLPTLSMKDILYKIQEFSCKSGWAFSKISSLMEETFEIRRVWIRDKRPPVTNVIEKFPHLAEPKIGGPLTSVTETTITIILLFNKCVHVHAITFSKIQWVGIVIHKEWV